MKNTLDDLVARNVLPDDQGLIKAVELACEQPNAFLAIVNFTIPAYEYISPTCLNITGYSHEAYLEGGPHFIFSTTTPEASLKIAQNQNDFARHSRVPDFDPATLRINQLQLDFHSGFGYIKKIMILGLPLTYTPSNDIQIGIALHTELNEGVIQSCSQHLSFIKALHNRSYRHNITIKKEEPLQKIFIRERPQQALTLREEEVLKLMAKGLTSLEIADQLFIAENTVESHRKNLFRKLEAKNMAELIKKASKLYWLE